MKSSNIKLKSLSTSQENEKCAPLPQLQRPMSGNDLIVIREDSYHEKRVNLDQPIKVIFNYYIYVIFNIILLYFKIQ